MRKQYVLILLVGFVAIIVGGSLFAITSLSSSRRFVSTDNAQVVADLVQVGSMNAGRIRVLNVDVGSAVVEGQVIAIVELPTEVSKSGTTDTAKIGFLEVQDLQVDVLAPRSGIIAARWVKKGDIVPTGQRIVTLMDPRQVWVEANIEEDKISRVRPGQTVEVKIDSLRRTLTGRVDTISPVTTATLGVTATGSPPANLKSVDRVIPIKIILDANQPDIIPGVSAEIKIRTH
ncbi:MAG TPA: HlyD family efflux transporter periplasmic adaptor subunit [Gemmatimonadetes bacterium]|nr:HlyD family efflux transporter periplasmic adaptor subunit [Gemmatimonadota bacterium]